MGQKISSQRFTSSVSPNQHPHHHPRGRRLSLGSLEGSTSNRSLSCLRGHSEDLKHSYICSHNSLYTRTFQRSKSQDREPSSLSMASQQQRCNCLTQCTHCNSCTLPARHRSEDVQNGNTVEGVGASTCVKSSSVERYMSALTERGPGNGQSKCYVQPSTSNNGSCVCGDTYKVRTKSRNKLVTSKSCSKQLDRISVTPDCFACVRDGSSKERVMGKTASKKKRWVPRFYGSKLSKNAGKITTFDATDSTDSGLDIVGSNKDSNCVCTLYRKMDDSCRLTQNNTDGASANAQSSAPASAACVHSTNTVCSHHEVEVGRCSVSRCTNNEFTAHNLLNLPINITVSRVGQPMYSALLTTASSNSSNVYGTLSHNGNANIYGAVVAEDGNSILFSVGTQNTPLIDLRLSAEDYPVEDCEERARVRRAWEIAEGVDPPPGYRPHIQVLTSNEVRALFLQKQSRIHTQVDFIHCLVPDLKAINQCSFYWGKMDRYEAERLLEGKPEGTFLLRDSAQEDYLFSVSFRKYGRSLHARIEQFNHKFSFDSHDPGVYAANTVTGLIEHYKDPACVMFFEPMLTAPLSRTHVFPLQHICRAVIASCTTYDGINELRLPSSLKVYLKEYHYRQRVRVKRFEGTPEGFWAPGEAL